jgi:signal transduction histidine kinase
MNEGELLHAIRTACLGRVEHLVAQNEDPQCLSLEQAEAFFDLYEKVLSTGEMDWLDAFIQNGTTALTETELKNGSSSKTRLLGEWMQLTLTQCHQQLSPGESQQVTSALLPAFLQLSERIARSEIQTRVEYATRDIETKRQNLERLERSKSDFIAVAAHELKTPLTLIDGYTAMLRDSLASREQAEADILMLDGIHAGARRLRSIVEDMIDVSLLDNQMLSLTYQPVWINRLLEGLQAELKKALQERSQTLQVADFPGSDQMLFGDPERLAQVFRNVILNAIKYTPDGGSIEVGGRELPGFLEVWIHDNGIGIDPEDQVLVFEKFTRLSDSALHSSGKIKFKGGGPGLGLHIAKGMVEAHGGRIWVESPGYDEKTCPGSTFHILLPLQTEPPKRKTGRLFAPLLNRQSSLSQS